ncbi:hypothetical protein CPC08DRAFT_648754 [Agrocybe pediades]|nr:hypothetical protein CPC08DRAFT_648754 [Agrocybe pediades]
MRYASCTADDVSFLRSLVAGNNDERPSITHPDFRNVSIITAWNVQKDKVNEIGCQRFAEDTGQELQHFFAIDKTDADMEDSYGRRKRGRKPKIRGPTRLRESDREILWSSPPSTSDHVAGKISLCVGMPIMVRHNFATELCITKGQEGVVHGWDSSVGPDGKPCLDTLYVKLSNPPRNINIPGLDCNVVPIPKSSTTITCKLPDDSTVRVNRTQICVLPNFSMTDYASQGKTRLFNVVDLGHCRSHQSYYTCLSRSSSASGTIILQGFDTKKITSGISGHLRQEFRELEMLNDITRLRYEGKLPDHVNGFIRRPLIKLFQQWKGDACEGSDWHPSIKWSPTDKKLLEEKDDLMWNERLNANIAATRTVERNLAKRKMPLASLEVLNEKSDSSSVSNKKKRTSDSSCDANSRDRTPVGLQWDNVHYSCAYDSVFTVIYNVWKSNPLYWSDKWTDYSSFMKSLCREFQRFRSGIVCLEDARDAVRKELHVAYPDMFRYGSHCSTDISELLLKLLGNDKCYGRSVIVCEGCSRAGGTTQVEFGVLNICTRGSKPGTTYSVTEALGMHNNYRTGSICSRCIDEGMHNFMVRRSVVHEIPDLLVIGCCDGRMIPELEMYIDHGGIRTRLSLVGIVYGDGTHFVSRIVDST